VRLLLGHPSAKATINHRNDEWGDGAVAGLLVGPWGGGEGAAGERGRPHHRPQRRHHPHGHRQAGSSRSYPGISAEGRRECVAALEVRSLSSLSPNLSTCSLNQLAEACLALVAGGGAGLPAVEGPAGGRPAGERRGGGGGGGGRRGRRVRALVDFAVKRLKGDLFRT
jgi:hypothetical protein